MTLTRRALFGGFAGLLVAPAIVRAASIMSVKALPGIPLSYRIDFGIMSPQFATVTLEAPGEWRRFGESRIESIIVQYGKARVIALSNEPEMIDRMGFLVPQAKILGEAMVPVRYEYD